MLNACVCWISERKTLPFRSYIHLCLPKVKEQNLSADNFVDNYREIRHAKFCWHEQFTKTAKMSVFLRLQVLQCEVRKKPS